MTRDRAVGTVAWALILTGLLWFATWAHSSLPAADVAPSTAFRPPAICLELVDQARAAAELKRETGRVPAWFQEMDAACQRALQK